jgi:hypothetical protein
MSFKEIYTTESKKADKTLGEEAKDKENNKITITEEAFLIAELLTELNHKLDIQRFK